MSIDTNRPYSFLSNCRGVRLLVACVPLLLGACSNGWEDVTELFSQPPASATQTASAAPQSRAAGTTQFQRDLALANRLSAGSDRQAALEAWINMRATYPARVETAIGLGEAYLALNRPRESAPLFERVLETEAEHGQALAGLGRSLVKTEQAAGAIPILDRAAAAQPWDVRVWNARGVALDMLNRHLEAQTSYRTGLTMDPDNKSLINNLGLSLALAGRVEEAISLLQPVAAQGDDPRARQTLSLVYGLKGDDEKAANVAKTDLDKDAVEQNVRVFQLLRKKPET